MGARGVVRRVVDSELFSIGVGFAAAGAGVLAMVCFVVGVAVVLSWVAGVV